ncbi:MAG: hypothetical protein WB402_08945, partial [Sulfuricaulis sp.]|uniref:hypothetical protein n=1 Tax=Sulfuricaulis sp. TaxID=2003553 RepID=UPI003C48C020
MPTQILTTCSMASHWTLVQYPTYPRQPASVCHGRNWIVDRSEERLGAGAQVIQPVFADGRLEWGLLDVAEAGIAYGTVTCDSVELLP